MMQEERSEHLILLEEEGFQENSQLSRGPRDEEFTRQTMGGREISFMTQKIARAKSENC